MKRFLLEAKPMAPLRDTVLVAAEEILRSLGHKAMRKEKLERLQGSLKSSQSLQSSWQLAGFPKMKLEFSGELASHFQISETALAQAGEFSKCCLGAKQLEEHGFL